MKKIKLSALFFCAILILSACTRQPTNSCPPAPMDPTNCQPNPPGGSEAFLEGIDDATHDYNVIYYPLDNNGNQYNPPPQPNGNPGTVNRSASCTFPTESFSPPAGIAFSPVSTIIGNISTQVTATIQSIYTGIVGNSSFKMIVNITLTMFIVLYGIAIMTGLATPSAHDFIMRAVKVALIVALINPSIGWNFFNNYVVNFFTSATNYLIGQMTCAFAPPGAVYCLPGSTTTAASAGLAAVDGSLSTFFNWKFWRLPFGLIMTPSATGGFGGINWTGVLAAVLLVFAVVIYIIAILHGVYLYVVALIARALLFSIAPLFFILLLFGQTSKMFEGWLKQVINFSLQPVFVFAFIAFFNGIIGNMFNGILGGNQYALCYYELFEVNTTTLISNAMTAVFNSILGFGGWLSNLIYGYIAATAAWGVAQCAITDVDPIAAAACNAAVAADAAKFALIIGAIQLGVPQFLTNMVGTFLSWLGWNPVYPWYWWQFFNTTPNNGPNTFVDSSAYPALAAINNKMMSMIPVNWQGLIILIVLSYLMYKMIDWAKGTASYLSEGLVSLAPGGVGETAKAVGNVAMGAKQGVTKVAGVAGKGLGAVKSMVGRR